MAPDVAAPVRVAEFVRWPVALAVVGLVRVALSVRRGEHSGICPGAGDGY